MHVISTITIMSKHTHDITILALLSTHAPLIYKHVPTPNPSFPIYQLFQQNNWQLSTNAKNRIIHQLGFIEESKTKFNRATASLLNRATASLLRAMQHNPPPPALAYITRFIFFNNTQVALRTLKIIDSFSSTFSWFITFYCYDQFTSPM
jgi:hypothetical protein